MGFLEANSSFAINIGFKETKIKKSVVFKPYINIAKADEYQVKIIKNYLKLEFAKIRIKTKAQSYHNDYYSLNIQNRKDIDKVISLIQKNGFKSGFKKKSFNAFEDCYVSIQKLGDYHHEWLDGFTDIIHKKISINNERGNIDKNRLSAKEWEKRIKTHFQ